MKEMVQAMIEDEKKRYRPTKNYLEVLTRMVTESQKQLADLKRQIQEINWQRKSSQTNAGEQLKLLESSWVGLVSKNYEIERACLNMEARLTEKEADRARAAAMAVDNTPIEDILERQHPKYVPSPTRDTSPGEPAKEGNDRREKNHEHDNNMEEDEQYHSRYQDEQQDDSPPQPPPQERTQPSPRAEQEDDSNSNDNEEDEEDEDDDDSDEEIGPQPKVPRLEEA